jgi:hypothetical protein
LNYDENTASSEKSTVPHSSACNTLASMRKSTQSTDTRQRKIQMSSLGGGVRVKNQLYFEGRKVSMIHSYALYEYRMLIGKLKFFHFPVPPSRDLDAKKNFSVSKEVSSID